MHELTVNGESAKPQDVILDLSSVMDRMKNQLSEHARMLEDHLMNNMKLTLWICVKDRLPDENEYVLLYDSSLHLVYEGRLMTSNKLYRKHLYYSDRAGYSKDIGDECQITHWMPLPEPPKEDI